MGTNLSFPLFVLPALAFRPNKRMAIMFVLTVVLLLLLPVLASASTSGAAFKDFYDFVYDAATGYLGRGIAIVGGLIMLGVAAGSGKATIAILGVVLAIFGALGPGIINSIFNSAII
ncbi:MAG TPA: hypothetical protein PLE99_05660 [Candidatus Thiothrix moscowensis]|uniref:hypothetical protein n=1 Tax=unclassified Thiothrix TaxID=2636184 RepID=UPI0025F37C10|nr:MULTISPECIES: hypothetical protein [unclassified Thiothrix]HRJ52230.1 hypothetical protein [Candidatus Thiothrix moscowensis]HRJ92545.1 hypothetical protein [Candidatus Thiothrix moscowensis]